MSIKKTNNGSYRLRVYIPDEVQGKLGMGRRYEKRFKTRREAKEAEIKLAIDIENARAGKTPTLSVQKRLSAKNCAISKLPKKPEKR